MPDLRGRMKVLASVALVAVIAVLFLKLAFAPLYGSYSADECRRAYARARTRIDTVAVDFRPYASPLGGRRPRCSELRGDSASSAAQVVGRLVP